MLYTPLTIARIVRLAGILSSQSNKNEAVDDDCCMEVRTLMDIAHSDRAVLDEENLEHTTYRFERGSDVGGRRDQYSVHSFKGNNYTVIGMQLCHLLTPFLK